MENEKKCTLQVMTDLYMYAIYHLKFTFYFLLVYKM